MFLLPDRLKRLLQRLKRGKGARLFLQDAEMVTLIRKVAKEQGRSEDQFIEDLMKAGLDSLAMEEQIVKNWGSLSHREQEVVALTCLGYRNYEIAETLNIAPETVKTHLQNIFGKFDLRSRKELRLAMKNWDFAGWWKHDHG